jgi:uncharacterized delta-60 repeat protein
MATANPIGAGVPPANAVAVQRDGKIVVAGARVRGAVYDVIRFRADGSRDPAFGSGIPRAAGLPIHHPRAVRIDGRGRIVIAGDGPDIAMNFVVARLTRSGHVDDRFGHDGAVTTDFGGYEVAFALALQRDGKIVAGGFTGRTLCCSRDGRVALARYLATP